MSVNTDYTRTTEAHIDPATGKVYIFVQKLPSYREDGSLIGRFERDTWTEVARIGPFPSLKAAKAAREALDEALAFAYNQGRNAQVLWDQRNPPPAPKPARLVVAACPECKGIRFEVELSGERYRCLRCQALFDPRSV